MPTYPANLIFLDYMALIILVKSTKYEVPHHHAIVSSLLSLPSSQVETFFSASSSQISSIYLLLFKQETKSHAHTK
jgi:hypothetical protein